MSNNVKTSLKQIGLNIFYEVELPERSAKQASAKGLMTNEYLLATHLRSFDKYIELFPFSKKNNEVWKKTIRPMHLRHAIECCYKEFKKSKYTTYFEFLDKIQSLHLNDIELSQCVLDNFLHPITDTDGLLFLRYFLRFKRLTLILCMNPDYLTHSVIIDKKNKTIIDWYRIVYERLKQLSTSHTGVNSVTTTITTEFDKITTLYNSCKPLFEAFIEAFNYNIKVNLLNLKKTGNNVQEFELNNFSNKSKPPGYTANKKGIPKRNFRQSSSLMSGGKQYIKLQKGGKRLIRQGPRGGKYYMKGGNKVYIK